MFVTRVLIVEGLQAQGHRLHPRLDVTGAHLGDVEVGERGARTARLMAVRVAFVHTCRAVHRS
jgi:hypothetical protein